MAALIYSFCALTSLACAVLLLRGYQRSRVALLFWSGLCFLGLTASNFILVLDRVVYPEVDLSGPRLWSALIGLMLLVFGLVWERD